MGARKGWRFTGRGEAVSAMMAQERAGNRRGGLFSRGLKFTELATEPPCRPRSPSFPKQHGNQQRIGHSSL